MSVATSKETLCINQVIGQKTDTAMVEEDFIVPDIKPDILNMIHTNGTVCIYKKEILDGKVRLDGCINTYIMYLADEEQANIRSLNTTLEFSKTVEFNNIKQGMMLEDKVTLKTVECKVLNGRKINIKAIIDVDLKIVSNENIEFVNSVDDLKDIQILNENINLDSLLGTGLTKVYAKDTIMIDNVDNLSEIMKIDVNIINKETKISYNKVLIKADASIKMLYLTDDNRMCVTNQLIPIMGFIDVQDISDDDICNVNYEIKNLLVKPNNVEEHSVYIEVELEVNCNAYRMKTVNLIQDLYSPSVNLSYRQKQIKAISQRKIVKDLYSIREKQFVSEIGSNKIYDVDVKPNIIKQTILKDHILYEGEININFLFGLDRKEIILPFNYNMECNGIVQNSEIETNIEISLQDFTILTDENIDIKIDLEFIVEMNNTKAINVIEEINLDENRQEERHSLVIYFVKSGDTLWNIAKKFHSTIEKIVDINAIENENKINVGDQLFIPIT
ncbi:MAG: DUF3794 domain-containing protein [Clostridiaceae bacterium]|nr:DUF3794 domain-containing protein [Clostridiaceae bacterium]